MVEKKRQIKKKMRIINVKRKMQTDRESVREKVERERAIKRDITYTIYTTVYISRYF